MNRDFASTDVALSSAPATWPTRPPRPIRPRRSTACRSSRPEGEEGSERPLHVNARVHRGDSNSL